MGQMHVIRDICQGVAGITIIATDFDDTRLQALEEKSVPIARDHNVEIRVVNTQKESLCETFSYYIIMVPIGILVAEAIQNSVDGCLINIFAGVPASTRQELDLDTYIDRRCFMFGTSGSVIRDMQIVLNKVSCGQLDTNRSIAAISGIAGASDGMKAIRDRTLSGKIIVYPMLHQVGLIPLEELNEHFPSVVEKLDNGMWNKGAEEELLRVAQES